MMIKEYNRQQNLNEITVITHWPLLSAIIMICYELQ